MASYPSIYRRVILFTVAALLFVLPGQAAPPPTREEIRSLVTEERSPMLFLSAAEVQSIKTRAETDPVYQKALREGILANAATAFVALSPERRMIPKKENTRAHEKIITHLQNLALGYAFSSDREQARRAVEVLLEYASFYKTLSPSRSRAGRLTAQTLNEAMLMIRIAWAFDLVTPALSPEEAKVIENDLLREGANLIRARDNGRSNWQAWHNAALGIIGLTLRDASLVEHSILGPSGFVWQLEHSMDRDGLWYELSISYQDFTMHALTLLAEAAARVGINLYKVEVNGHRLHSFYLAPIYFSYSNLNQAPYHDAHPGARLASGAIAWNYPYLWKHTRDPAFLWLWQASGGLDHRTSNPRIPLLLAQSQIDAEATSPGGPVLPPFAVGSSVDAATGLRHVVGSTLFPESGVAILRGPPGSQGAEMSLIWKPLGTQAGHQHPNNLAMDWQSTRHRWISTSGKWVRYTSELHRTWVKQSLSDNTVIVDRVSQKPIGNTTNAWATDPEGDPSSGQLVAFTNGPVFGYVRAASDKVYPGTRLDRRLVHTKEYTLDFFFAKASRMRTFDWVVHISGEMAESSIPMAPVSTPRTGGIAYAHLGAPKSASADSSWTTHWREEGIPEQLVLTTLGAPETTYTVATTPWKNRDRSTVLVTREGRETAFASVLRTRTDADPIKAIEWKKSAPLSSNPEEATLLIELSAGKQDWLIWHREPKRGLLADGAVQYHARDILARFRSDHSLEAATLTGGTQLETATLSLEADSVACWSWSEISGEAFLLIHDNPSATRFTVRSSSPFVVRRLGKNGEMQEEVTADESRSGRTWLLEPFTNYLFATPTFSDALPALTKEFRP